MPLPMPGMSVTFFSLRVLQNGRNRFRITFDGRGGVAVAADAERILTRDFHQVRGLGKQNGNLAIFHRLYEFSFQLIPESGRWPGLRKPGSVRLHVHQHIRHPFQIGLHTQLHLVRNLVRFQHG